MHSTEPWLSMFVCLLNGIGGCKNFQSCISPCYYYGATYLQSDYNVIVKLIHVWTFSDKLRAHVKAIETVFNELINTTQSVVTITGES